MIERIEPAALSRREDRMRRTSRTCGALVALVGAVVLLGWALDLETVKRIAPTFTTMKANTALSLVVGGGALWAFTRPSLTRWVSTGLAVAVIAIGALTLVEHISGSDFRIDQMLFPDPDPDPDQARWPGRMPPSVAACFVAIGAALLLARTRTVIAHFLASAVGGLALVAVLGYLYGVQGLHTISDHASIALHTAGSFLVLSFGLILATPTRGISRLAVDDGPAGVVIRRLLPLSIVIPVLVGFVIVQGEQRGIYEGLFATALVVVATVVVTAILVSLTAYRLLEADRQRSRAQLEMQRMTTDLERESFFRTLAENVSDLIIRMDPSGRITYASPASEPLLGYRPEEMLGRTALDFVPPEAEAELQRVYGNVFNGKSSTTQQPVRRRDGSEVWIEGVASPTIDPVTKVTNGIIWIVRDASEHLAELEREREVARREQELNQLKNEFVGIVAHDLKSPMTVIGGFADIMVQQWDQIDDTDKQDFLRRIRDNIGRLSTLVDDALQVSRIESGDIALELGEVDIADLICRTAEELGNASPDRCIEVHAPPGLPLVSADEDRTWRIITNLLSNALKFSEADQPVEVAIERKDGEVEVSVTDHGHGIAPEDMDKLFQRFTRLQQPKGKAIKGTGLGLYITRSLVEAQGGRISASSCPGEGSTFRFTVPLAREGSV